MTYDRTRGILYLMEPFTDGDQPVVHVFQIQKAAGDGTLGTITTMAS